MCEHCGLDVEHEVEDEADETCQNCGRERADLVTVNWMAYSPSAGAVRRSELWCEDCAVSCTRCGEWYRRTDMFDVWDDMYCDGCTTRCEHCNSLMPVDPRSPYCSDDCAEAASVCACDAPSGLEFTIRNDGDEPLANDTRVKVTLPSGMISHEGIQEIRCYLATEGHVLYSEPDDEQKKVFRTLSMYLDRLEPEWQTKEGNYAKRLSKLAYTICNGKLPPKVMSQVGVIAREHSKPVDLYVEVTRNLNLPSEEFYNEDSCWWGGYSYSRCALKSSGGFGLRTFRTSESQSWEGPTGRAWVLPMRLTGGGYLTPTFNTTGHDAFVVFNGYGDLEGYAPARVMSHMAGWTYRKISFIHGRMFVNGGSAYLVAPEEIASQPFHHDIDMGHVTEHHLPLWEQEQERAEQKEHEYV